MIEAIGTGKSGAPLVLSELDRYEWEDLFRVLRIAAAHLDDITAPALGSRRQRAEQMIVRLARAHGIDPEKLRPNLYEGVSGGD